MQEGNVQQAPVPPYTEERTESSGGQGHGHGHADPRGRALVALTIGALGVVYGDIGTSPLYAFRESFHPEHGIPVTAPNVLGILSLIFWSLILIISIKYIAFVMRADNHGEGGILALTALVTPIQRVTRGSRRWMLILFGIFGTALLYGDGIITPAISVLSAVEGLEIATDLFSPYIIPLTLLILIGLFSIQSRGTERVGTIFGPLTVIWFLVLAGLGIRWIRHQPSVLWAINPLQGLRFFTENGWEGFLVLGSVFLVVTGGEALYADMGHFGKRPIRLAWFTVVLPALLLNYFGQGALLIENPEAVENPFYYMVPEWALIPVVLIATAATVIASQALITGAFSLTRQAVQLGYLPRVEIRQTSAKEIGQIYIPVVNRALMVACLALVIAFRTSTNLAAAYGVAVTTTMVITVILLAFVERDLWKWSIPQIAVFTTFFLVIDLAFWGANIIKFFDGGWLPLAIGVFIFTLMRTWKRGRELLQDRLRVISKPIMSYIEELQGKPIHRVPGTAVFMNSNANVTPPAMRLNVEHNKVLHKQLFLLSVKTNEIPRVPQEERIEFSRLADNMYQVTLCYGFKEDPDVPRDLKLLNENGVPFDPDQATYFLGRESLRVTTTPGMPIWRENLFALMSRNARNATDFFRLPTGRVVEIGTQVEL